MLQLCCGMLEIRYVTMTTGASPMLSIGAGLSAGCSGTQNPLCQFHLYPAVAPPSTTSVAPFMKEDESVARKSAA